MKWKTKALSILLSGLMLTSSMGVGMTAFAAEDDASSVAIDEDEPALSE